MTQPFNDPKHYVLSEPLSQALKLARLLSKPLLVTGAPGTGKTQLATKCAYDLFGEGYKEHFFSFVTKTTSTASDLFYRYDAIGHYQKRGIGSTQTPTANQYIELTGLGLAIMQTHGSSSAMIEPYKTLKGFEKLSEEPKEVVVLVDEIDKAPRDFPNDLLVEIEKLEFSIPEIELNSIKKNPGVPITIILTSNIERNLPEAFLRRCLFYHIPKPTDDELLHIVETRLKPVFEHLKDADLTRRYENLLARFKQLRPIVNSLTTSTLLEWLFVLENEQYFALTEDAKKIEKLRLSLPVLSKTKEEQEELLKRFSQ